MILVCLQQQWQAPISFLLVCLMPSCMTFIYFLILVLISTALLICMENTFWNINGDNFVNIFKKSFTLYVESGRKEMTERDIEILRNDQGEISASRLYEFIVDHYLRKFHCFYLHSSCLITGTLFAYWIQPNLRNKRMEKRLHGFKSWGWNFWDEGHESHDGASGWNLLGVE